MPRKKNIAGSSPTVKELKECAKYLKFLNMPLGIDEEHLLSNGDAAKSKTQKKSKKTPKKHKKEKNKTEAKGIFCDEHTTQEAHDSLDPAVTTLRKKTQEGVSKQSIKIEGNNSEYNHQQQRDKKVKLKHKKLFSLFPLPVSFPSKQEKRSCSTFGRSGENHTNEYSEQKRRNTISTIPSEHKGDNSTKPGENELRERWNKQTAVSPKKVSLPLRKRVAFHTSLPPFQDECSQRKSTKGHVGALHVESTDKGGSPDLVLFSSPPLNYNDEVNVHGPRRRKRDRSEVAQATPETYNSQDLFLTQKTFLIEDGSSGEIVCATTSQRESKHDIHTEVDLASLQPSAGRHQKHTAEKATQTKDFFSSREFTTYYKFYRQCSETEYSEQAVDLSLPNRARGTDSTGRESVQCMGQREAVTLSNKYDSALPNALSLAQRLTYNISNVENEISFRNRFGISQFRKGEDGKYVQTRLNESFFFKVKGDGDSPKPQSPLMKLEMNEKKMK